jgi:hypothetical protein
LAVLAILFVKEAKNMKQEKQRDNPYAANHSKAERMTLAT